MSFQCSVFSVQEEEMSEVMDASNDKSVEVLKDLVRRLSAEAEGHQTVFSDDRRRKELLLEAAYVLNRFIPRPPPDTRHHFQPHKKYPWFCGKCGYSPHERLMHFQENGAGRPSHGLRRDATATEEEKMSEAKL
jgi:ribosomal protein S27AE